MINKNIKILIVGLGLIGGSYAKALRKKGFYVTAITNDQKSIDYALNEKIIDEGYDYVNEKAVSDAELVVFALYPNVFVEWVKQHGHLFSKGTIITDVTGVKQCIVYDIQNSLPQGVEFIAAHPMAGKEVYGVENSDDKIFEGANYIVVPTEKNTPEAIETCKDLGKVMGFNRISVLSPEEHDKMIGFVSQLTHVIAVGLMTCSDNEHLVDYTGDSFRDLTRIARINENMWSELFMLNKDALLKQFDTFIEECNTLRTMIKEEDTERLKEKMRLSTKRRSLFDKK
ncbi:MAG: prephenate dehydrogenase [Clostridia bacterium]|nr:prephenate dehydrogenase [Clostridia bacterium]